MRRLGPRDIVLLVILLPLWIAALALHISLVARGELAWVGAYVDGADSADELPIVRGFWPSFHPAADGLAVGDRLVAVGGRDLRGVGPLGFVARVYEAARRGSPPRVAFQRDGRAGEAVVPLVPVAFPWRVLPLTVSLVVTGALVLIRRPGTRVARAFFLAAVAFALHWTFCFGGPRAVTYAWAALFLVASTLVFPLALRVPFLLTPETTPADGRLPRWPWLFALFGPVSVSWVFGTPLPPELALRAVFVVNVAFIGVLLFVLTRNLRRATPVGRRQIKWAVLGIYLGTVPVLAADAVTVVVPRLYWLHDAACLAEIFIPLSILIAVVRFNLFDVDRLITATAVYTCLSVLVAAALLAIVPRVALAMSTTAVVDRDTAQLVLSIVVASAAVPAARLLRPRIERLFFPERQALTRGIETLLQELGGAADASALFTLVVERLHGLVHPRTLVLYGGDPPEPVLARGLDPSAVVVLPADGRLVAALREQRAPLDVGAFPEPARVLLPAADRAFLDRLQAALLLPLWRGPALAGVLCMGEKASGDVYTTTDAMLLATVADKLSSELARFDQDELLRQERAMRATIGQYVPAPVAARLEAGHEVGADERELSVLFVDIRGYTTFSESREAGAVFSVVNRYTEAVSHVVRAHGGTIVEFLGDGLMAVFGAPEVLPGHARAAVSAAGEIVQAVAGLTDGGQAVGIAVGVGIATGPAFVGNVRAVDRLIYTAVGDTVNLASRLQSLTRDLDAAVAVDAATHAAAGDAAREFTSRPQIAIRGRREPVDVFVLPLATGAH